MKHVKAGMRLIDSSIGKLTLMGGWGAMICVLAMTALIGVEAFGRVFIAYSTGFCDELSGYLLVTVTFLGAGYTLRAGSHVYVDLIVRKLSKKTRRNLSITTSIIATAYCLIIFWYSLKQALYSLRVGAESPTHLRTPEFIPQSMVPLGMILLSFALISYTIQLFRSSSNKK